MSQPDQPDHPEHPLQAAFLRHEQSLAPAGRMVGEDDSAVYRTLLESTKAIPWKIDWATMAFAYIGPQIEALLGWAPSSWKTVNDWADRMHPDDREAVVNFCVAQSQAGTDHEADYRALTRDGGYVWLRDVVHVVRKPSGEVESLIGFMFDISERKRTEEQLAQLQKELERLSFTDGLTGVGNRRMFDTVVEREWAALQDAGKPLSLILMDVDFFKAYNDYYGHLQGDDCLRKVAALLADAVGAEHFVGRFGGEEFVAVLPGTDADTAVTIAERCRTMIADAAIPHLRSPYEQRVTASFGVGTTLPVPGAEPTAFINLVDAQLYHAKDNGRNRIAAVDRAGMQGEGFRTHSR
ncbi:PAS domain S-box-containing protein/diguanylate cyclase (GGDEF) domain-containing protein [Cupriavidus sp. OV038]|jgi:diguanylate cyclase (GGDEF)-like protein/PAS domain S-box-containing protein|uniref:GGDEF domain-containing protein n=1 Tax=unclassified Cupriavidus TaxID=2640874 RepID=UPI0008E959F7|nr:MULTISPECIES: sensor domain-containing diguanylate cyclase [unclassified Cupriavidus]SFC18290.1 PAS domain S-box-containing protein/diguanylate cyclase (GGDEF) domain-containing protein [Cupriavidus sp. OV038]SFP13424.1 PAS domain S-box-containing protein/diguanylate cyclase (GGDEF) domain-containing protein [Cupriavidus sp. OV096]